MRLATKIFAGAALVVVAALGDRPARHAKPRGRRSSGGIRTRAPGHALGDRRRDGESESEPPPAHRRAGPGAGLRVAHRRGPPHRRSRQPPRPGRRAARANGRGLGADRRRRRRAQGLDGAAERGGRGFLPRRVDRAGARGTDHGRPVDRVGAGSRPAVSGGWCPGHQPRRRREIRRGRRGGPRRQHVRVAAQAAHRVRDPVLLARHGGGTDAGRVDRGGVGAARGRAEAAGRGGSR